MIFIRLTERRTGLESLFNMSTTHHVEKRSRGAAIYWPGMRHPLRVEESVVEIEKRIRRAK